MAQSLTITGRLLVRKIFLFQCTAVIMLTLISALIWKVEVALAVFAGGSICIVANLVFGRMAFRYAGASKNKQVVKSFNQGLKLKLFLSIILFVLALRWLNLPFLPLMCGYVAALLAQLPGVIFSDSAK